MTNIDKWASEFQRSPKEEKPRENEKYVLIDSVEKLAWLNEVLDSLPDNHLMAYDHETTGFYWMTDIVVGTSFSWADGEAAYLPYWHIDREESGFGRAEVRAVHEKLKRFKVIAHKIVFDSTFTYMTFGLSIPIWDDTYLIAKLLEKPLSLQDIALQAFGVERTSFKEEMARIFGKTWKSKGYTCADAEAREFAYYACGDADDCRKTYFRYKPQMKKRNLNSLHKIEVNVLPIVRKLNIQGVPVDSGTSALVGRLLVKQNDEIEKQIYKLAGHEFKINSPKECPQVLFTELGLPVIDRSEKTGAPSTDKNVMEALLDAHPIIPLIKQWREDTRLEKAYMGKIPRMIDKRGRVHSEFNSYAAVSGRFTSSGNTNAAGDLMGFNLQNIAKKEIDMVVDQGWDLPEGLSLEEVATVTSGDKQLYDALHLMDIGCKPVDGMSLQEVLSLATQWKLSVREMFIAPKGWKWIKADLSQIEYRLLANLAGEEYLISRLKAGHDFHIITAAIFLDILDAAVTKKQRDTGKIVNFTLAYGGGAAKAAKTLGISTHEAEKGFERYWERLPKVAQLAEFCRERARVEGITKTYFGLIRTLNFYKGISNKARDKELRKSLNTMIQGSAAEFLKLGMLRVDQALKPFKNDIELLLQVHDELDFIVKNEILLDVCPIIKNGMEVPTPEKWAPTKVDIGFGPNWAEKNHTAYKQPDDYEGDEFTGWGKVMPDSILSHAEV